MHASKESIILAQWELWNETLYDILIASVSLSPSQMDHVSKSFASTSDGQAFYRWVLSHADNRKESAQIRLKTRLRDLKLTADMSSDQVKAVLEDLGNIWPQIIEHNLVEDWSRPAIRKALSLFPPRTSRWRRHRRPPRPTPYRCGSMDRLQCLQRYHLRIPRH